MPHTKRTIKNAGSSEPRSHDKLLGPPRGHGPHIADTLTILPTTPSTVSSEPHLPRVPTILLPNQPHSADHYTRCTLTCTYLLSLLACTCMIYLRPISSSSLVGKTYGKTYYRLLTTNNQQSYVKTLRTSRPTQLPQTSPQHTYSPTYNPAVILRPKPRRARPAYGFYFHLPVPSDRREPWDRFPDRREENRREVGKGALRNADHREVF